MCSNNREKNNNITNKLARYGIPFIHVFNAMCYFISLPSFSVFVVY